MSGLKRFNGTAAVSLRRALPGLLLMMMTMCAPSLLSARTPTEREMSLFKSGNEAYEASDFDGAVTAYEQIYAAGLESRDLYYNLANAHLRAGHIGRAILNYRRALRIDPKDEDARANLAYARRHTKDVAPQDVPDQLPWLTALRPGSERVAWLFTLALNLAALFFAASRILRRAPAILKSLSIVAAAAALMLGLIFYIELRETRADRLGVIVAEQAQVRIGPGDDYTMAFLVHEGTEAALGRNTDGWTEITVSEELKGWVLNESVEPVE